MQIHPYRDVWFEVPEGPELMLRVEPSVHDFAGQAFYVVLNLRSFQRRTGQQALFGIFSCVEVMRGQNVYQLVDIVEDEPTQIKRAVLIDDRHLRKNREFTDPVQPPVNGYDLLDALCFLREGLLADLDERGLLPSGKADPGGSAPPG